MRDDTELAVTLKRNKPHPESDYFCRSQRSKTGTRCTIDVESTIEYKDKTNKIEAKRTVVEVLINVRAQVMYHIAKRYLF